MIRPATPDDADWVCGIWNDVILRSTATFTTIPKTPVDIAELIATRELFLVDPEAGFATFGPFRAGPGYAGVREHTIYFSETAQGQGRGTALLSALELQARRIGIRALIGGLSGDNHRALRFHLANGYAKVAEMPAVGQKFGQQLDLVLVQKNLQDSAQVDDAQSG